MSTLPEKSIERRFLAFHAANPHIYDALLDLIQEARLHGASKLGIGQLWEVMRWQRQDYRTLDEGSPYRLNDHYRSRYARLIMKLRPELSGIFDVRALRSPSDLFDDADSAQLDLFEEGLQ